MGNEIRKVTALTVPEGAGVVVRRLMPVHGLMNFDPFVLCDHFDIDSGGFPDHPHRGFEAITYMFAGGMQHADNLGNRSTVMAGGLQRFTAGKGLVHSEMPQGRAEGIQLWINLPKSLKGMDPDYQQVDAGQIPCEQNGGVKVRTIVGHGSPTLLQTNVVYLDIAMEKGSLHQYQPPDGMRGFVFVMEGDIKINTDSLREGEAGLFDQSDLFTFMANHDSRFIVCFGEPHGEPIFQRGPYVD